MPGGSREQRIIVTMDTSNADRNGRVFDTAERARTNGRASVEKKAAKETVETWQQARDRIAKDQNAMLAKMVKAANEANRKMAREAKESAKARADADKSAAADSKRQNAEVDRAFARGQSEQIREHRQAMREKAASTRDSLRAERMQMSVAHRAKMMEWDLEQKALLEQKMAADSAASAALGYVGAFAGIGTIVMGVKSIAEYFDNIRRDTIDAVKETIHFREIVLELAAMKGDLGKSGPEVGRQLMIVAQTAQTSEDALAMSKKSEGAAQAAIGKNLDRGAYDEGFIAAAKLQAMEGPGAGAAYGDLYGTLAVEAKKGTTGKQMAARFNKEFRIQQPGKFSSMGEYASQRQELSGYVQNGMLTADEAAGLLSAASLASNPQEAATHLRQGMASLAADPMRARKMKMMPGQDQETSAAYFQEHLKLDLKHTRPMQMLDAVVADLAKAEKEASARGEVWNPHQYMIKHGINNREAREFYMDTAAVRKSGVWSTIKERMDEGEDADAIDKAHAARVGREPVLQQRLADAASKAATIKRGSGTAEGALMAIQEASFAKLKGQGRITGTFDEWKKRGYLGQAWDELTLPGYHEQVNIEAQARLAREAKKAGIDVTLPTRTDAKTGEMRTQYMGDEAMFDLQQRIQAAGGNPMAAVADDVKETNKILERIEAKIAGPGAPPGAPARRGNGVPLNLMPKALDGMRMGAGAF
jgi:hypothetical protein